MASIKINDKGAREQYTALAAETNFSYPFEIFEDEDLIVWLTPLGQTPDPVLDLLVLTTDYGVTNAGVEGGGDVVLNNPATAGDIVTIIRDLPIDRLFDYTVGGDFTGDSINQQLDILTMTQQQNESVNQTRQLTYPALEELETGDVTLPKLDTGQFWKKNASGAIVAVTDEENPDWSTLRTELLNDLSGSDGARIIGYYDSVRGSETVKDKLDNLVELPVDDTTSLVRDPVDNTKQMRIDVGTISASTVRVLTMPDKDVDLTNLQNVTLQQVRFFDGTYQNLGAATIPFDNSKPQITEGSQILSQAFTPLSATSKVLVEIVVYATSSGGDPIIAALFKDSDVNALAAGVDNTSLADQSAPIVVKYLLTPGSTTPFTLTVRLGGSGGTIHYNGSTSGALFNGVYLSSMIVTEYAN